ncbi:hypothetical protein SUGI_1035240 [Cryptomeria japonica]|nr:hypothetical protein SUGI_1035240 [Cryptomeria japonica]
MSPPLASFLFLAVGPLSHPVSTMSEILFREALLSWIIMDYHFQELKIEGFTSAHFKFEVAIYNVSIFVTFPS